MLKVFLYGQRYEKICRKANHRTPKKSKKGQCFNSGHTEMCSESTWSFKTGSKGPKTRFQPIELQRLDAVESPVARSSYESCMGFLWKTSTSSSDRSGRSETLITFGRCQRARWTRLTRSSPAVCSSGSKKNKGQIIPKNMVFR